MHASNAARCAASNVPFQSDGGLTSIYLPGTREENISLTSHTQPIYLS